MAESTYAYFCAAFTQATGIQVRKTPEAQRAFRSMSSGIEARVGDQIREFIDWCFAEDPLSLGRPSAYGSLTNLSRASYLWPSRKIRLRTEIGEDLAE